ncbi:MAG: proline iminopeptidase-family hydrolase [Candidatus Marinimicrobia bacterium]|nr:proline iminopeptidase-family hydrolase [Candidatus Neomarinimicrobiota bacterium]
MIKFRITVVIVLILFISCDITPRVEEGYIDIEDASLYFKIIGKGESLIVLHGGPGFDHQILMPYIGNLGKELKVVLYDQRGSGLSTGPIDSASINIDTFIDDIESIRKFLGVEKINLAGVSWGGILALYYGVRHPDKLNSLTLFSAAGSAKMLYKMYPAMRKKRTEDDSALMKELSSSRGYKNKDSKVLEEFYRTYCKTQLVDQSLVSKINMIISENTAKNMDVINNFIWASIGNFDLHDQLNVIDCPTLIMHGRHDPLPLEAAEKIRENIPNSELVIFENSGHWIFLEEAEIFNFTVAEFIQNLNIN